MFFVLSQAWDKEKLLPMRNWTFCAMSHARDKIKNIFLYFFNELKTNHLSYSISFLFSFSFSKKKIYINKK